MYGIPQERCSQSTGDAVVTLPKAGRRRYIQRRDAVVTFNGGTPSLHSTAGRRRYTANGETPSLPLPPFQHAMALDVGNEGVMIGKPVDWNGFATPENFRRLGGKTGD